MKKKYYLLLNLLLIISVSLSQETHTYSFKDWYAIVWQKINSGTPQSAFSESHLVGVYAGNGNVYEVRTVCFWKWTELNISKYGDVKSVRIKFRASSTQNNQDFQFTLHNISHNYNESGINYFNEITSDNILISRTGTRDSQGFVYFDETFTTGPILTALNAAVKSGNYYFALGIMQVGSSRTSEWNISSYDGSSSFNKPAIDLIIDYTTPDQYYTFINKIEGSVNYGSLVIDNDKAHPVSSNSASKTFPFNSNHTVRTNELPYVFNWNNMGKTVKLNRYYETQSDYNLHHAFTVTPTVNSVQDAYFVETKNASITTSLIDGGTGNLGNVEFNDPWKYYKDSNNDWFQTNQNVSYTAPFSIDNGSATSYGGVFLGQGAQNWNPPFYSVNAPDQNLSGFNTYFLNWSSNGGASFKNSTARQSGIIFTSAGATATANYKAQQATSGSTGIINNGQRKILRTANGTVHTVYESGGRVWYERKIAGGYWELVGGSDVVGSDAKSPSISCRGNNIIIVYQKKNMSNNSNYDIEYKMFDYSGFPQTSSVIVSNISSYSDDAQPVVASNTSGKTFIAWRQTSNSGAAGIYYSAGIVSSSGIYAQSIYGLMSSTDNYSSTPSVAVGNTADNYGKYHYPFAWTQNNTIKYRDIQYTNNGQWLNYTNGGETPLSAGSGYTYNYNPSVICYGANSARIAWIGKRFEEDPGESMGKTVAAGGKWAYRVIYNQDASSTFEVYGDYVNSVVINKNNNGSGDVSHAVAWSSSNGSVTTTRTSNGLFGEFRNNSNQINGRDVQLSNGSSFSDMYGYMLDVNTSAPYKLLLSDNDISTVQKVQFSAVNNGKEGVVYDSLAQFYFAIGDIVADEIPVGFNTDSDTTKTFSLTYLNSKLESMPFPIGDNSKLYYSVQYGLTDTSYGALAMSNGNTINFKVQLLDNQTSSVIGEFDNVTFSSQNLNQYKNIGYEVNTEGIGNKIVRIRLVVNAFPGAQYSLANRFNNESIISLGKSDSRRIKTRFDGSAIITDYTLSQNYPNPFNPTTTIGYTLPREGDVTLNIYDLLGKNVMTLVNNYQQSGRYEIEFDATKLSSGTYIYKLTSGSFTQTKKMMLIK